MDRSIRQFARSDQGAKSSTRCCSVARCGDRRRTETHRLLGPQAADVERRPGDQEESHEIHHIGLRWRDRPPHNTSDDGSWTGFVFHAVLLLEMVRDGKAKCAPRMRSWWRRSLPD